MPPANQNVALDASWKANDRGPRPPTGGCERTPRVSSPRALLTVPTTMAATALAQSVFLGVAPRVAAKVRVRRRTTSQRRASPPRAARLSGSRNAIGTIETPSDPASVSYTHLTLPTIYSV